MPFLLPLRNPVDNIQVFERAAEARLHDAEILQAQCRDMAAIYLFGYSAEMRIKAAYFRSISFTTTTTITPRHRRTAIDEAPVLGLPAKPGSHDIHGWAQLLIAKRAQQGSPYPKDLGMDILANARILSSRWSEILRYRANRPYQHEIVAVHMSAIWFRQNYQEM